MAAAGADLVVNCRRSAEEAEAVAAQIRDMGRRALVVAADVSQVQQAESLVSAALEHFGRIDILVNNAGTILDKPFELHSDEDWQSAAHGMLDSAFYVTRALVPHMVSRGEGRILAQNSIITEKFDFGGMHMSACAAAKAGICAMLRSLAAEIADSGVTVNMVVPGIVATEMTNDVDPQVLEGALQEIPMRRLGNSDDVASAMLFVASEHASYITGQTLRVNGGMHML